jgi:Fe2+ transport system protein FeoA
VETLDLPESVQNYLMHLGFLPEAQVTVLRRAPAGDPTVYAVDGMEIALRHETASGIRVHLFDDRKAGASGSEGGANEADSTPPAADEISASIELMEAELDVELGAVTGTGLGVAR